MKKDVYEFISKKIGDPIVQWKTCVVTGKEFAVFQSDLDFLEKVSPVFDGKKYLFPVPDVCPQERQRIKLAHINQINLFKTKCAATGEDIISNNMPTAVFKVVSQKYFYSDACDNMVFGRVFDSSRTFFEQWHELDIQTYQAALFTDYTKDVNSAYTNYAGKNRDCYMIFDADQNESCYYSYGVNSSKYAVDCYRCDKLEYCYEAIDCIECYKCAYIQNCKSCVDSYFLRNCENCKNCIMCSNLVNKEYYISNKSVSKEEFEAYKKQIGSHVKNTQLQEDFETYIHKFPQRYMVGVQNENVSGNYLVNSKNVQFSYDCRDTWDAKYVTQVFMQSKNSMDCDECGDCEVTYNCSNMGYNSYRIFFSYQCMNDLQDLYYCKNCFFCKNCFGCVGLKHKEYCILNKQYTQAEYDAELGKIILKMRENKEWGVYFPISLSAFPYNQTMAQEFYPLTKEQTIAQGFQWNEEDKKYLDKKFVLADTIDTIDESITKEILTCEITGRNYLITQQELAFYRKMGLPIPRHCFWARHIERLKKRPARELHVRNCNACKESIVSIYPEDSAFEVYCEKCYNKEVYA